MTGFLATAIYGPQRASYRDRVLAATNAPDPAVVREPSATLPLYGAELRALPPERLRELMKILHLTISYDQEEHTAQIADHPRRHGRG